LAVEALEDILYPAPAIRWYAAAERHPSLVENAATNGLREPLEARAAAFAKAAVYRRDAGSVAEMEKPQAEKMRESCTDTSAPIVVHVLGVEGVAAPQRRSPTQGSESGGYSVSAYYANEASGVAELRRTELFQATPGADLSARSDCTMDTQISVPCNKRQQFLKVALYWHSWARDDVLLVGEATVPIADPEVSVAGPWPLMDGLVEKGIINLSIRLPCLAPAPPDAATALASTTSGGESDDPSFALPEIATSSSSCAEGASSESPLGTSGTIAAIEEAPATSSGACSSTSHSATSLAMYADPATTKYDVSMLAGSGNRPDDVDPAMKERYLPDDQFQDIFGTNLKEFTKLAAWKQQQLKRARAFF